MDASRSHAYKLIDFISKHRRSLSPLLILTHDYPDPDAIGSAYALQYLAREAFGIRSEMVYGGIIGRMENRMMISTLKIPIRKLKRLDFKKFDNYALVDTQPGFRNNSLPEGVRANIVIDQHESDLKPPMDCFIHDVGCGATSVLLAQALLVMKLEIPARVATALAYGIVTDTMNFFRSRRPDIVKVYMEILPHCDMGALARIQNPAQSDEFFVNVAGGINNARSKGRLIVSHLGRTNNPDSVAQVADLLLSYRGIKWSLCTGRYKGTLRISLRAAERNMAASDVLKDIVQNRGDAGGHDTIAGGSLKVGSRAGEVEWKRLEDALVERLQKRIRVRANKPFVRPFK